jgi:hypothetical protein
MIIVETQKHFLCFSFRSDLRMPLGDCVDDCFVHTCFLNFVLLLATTDFIPAPVVSWNHYAEYRLARGRQRWIEAVIPDLDSLMLTIADYSTILTA